jgi:hypothetical protein
MILDLLLMATFAADVDAAAFLAGCWEAKRGASVVEEQWMKPSGGAMLGISRTVRNGKLAEREFLRIEAKDGVPTYFAIPGDRPAPTPFKLTKSGEGELVFENPEHDFPKRIIYRKTPEGVTARVEAGPKGFEFAYKRVACPE